MIYHIQGIWRYWRHNITDLPFTSPLADLRMFCECRNSLQKKSKSYRYSSQKVWSVWSNSLCRCHVSRADFRILTRSILETRTDRQKQIPFPSLARCLSMHTFSLASLEADSPTPSSDRPITYTPGGDRPIIPHDENNNRCPFDGSTC